MRALPYPLAVTPASLRFVCTYSHSSERKAREQRVRKRTKQSNALAHSLARSSNGHGELERQQPRALHRMSDTCVQRASDMLECSWSSCWVSLPQGLQPALECRLMGKLMLTRLVVNIRSSTCAHRTWCCSSLSPSLSSISTPFGSNTAAPRHALPRAQTYVHADTLTLSSSLDMSITSKNLSFNYNKRPQRSKH